MRLHIVIALFVIALFVIAACSNAQLGGLGGTTEADKKEKEEDIGESEEESVDEPQQVAGSWLEFELVGCSAN
jgi:hypothetical protein